VDPFADRPMVTLEAIEAWAGQGADDAARPQWLLPVDTAFESMPRLDLDARASLHLRQGRVLPLGLPPAAGTARAYDPAGRFLGLVEADPAGGLRVARLFVPGANASDAGTA